MTKPLLQQLGALNESNWIRLGTLSESLLPLEKAVACYESALRIHPYSCEALSALAACYRSHELYPQASDVYQRLLSVLPHSGDAWGALGHCYLMMDELQKAYSAYQQALYHLSNTQEPKLWYGIGILYDRYGSFEHAEEALSAVLRMDPHFEKANEIYFRLGIIFKQQAKFDIAIECFEYILSCPPHPLTRSDILFQLGHIYEQQQAFQKAKETYDSILQETPNHAKVLQQLGWLYQDQKAPFHDTERAVSLLSKSLDIDAKDAQTWYLLGRCFMHQQKYNEAYDAYQQAVYRDGRNPTFWCSIGVLYYQINQFSDALDAYGRAIRLNPYISEVWYDLGTLYESCNNQIPDAIDAYTRALELDPNNVQIKQRLTALCATTPPSIKASIPPKPAAPGPSATPLPAVISNVSPHLQPGIPKPQESESTPASHKKRALSEKEDSLEKKPKSFE